MRESTFINFSLLQPSYKAEGDPKNPDKIRLSFTSDRMTPKVAKLKRGNNIQITPLDGKTYRVEKIDSHFITEGLRLITVDAARCPS